VEQFLYGTTAISQMHELFFNTKPEAERALSTPPGQQQEQLLQQITGGMVSIFFAEHKEDDLENIRKYKSPSKS